MGAWEHLTWGHPSLIGMHDKINGVVKNDFDLSAGSLCTALISDEWFLPVLLVKETTYLHVQKQGYRHNR